MITIVDYGIGNLGSILNMFKKIGAEAQVTADLNIIADSRKLVLPGVGAFDHGMHQINRNGLRETLDKKVLADKVPILGICLGMQLLTRSSEEGQEPGLGWIPATTVKFPNDSRLKVPHMGWNTVEPSIPNPLTRGLDDESRFYFVHSYYVRADQENDSILKTEYGLTFDSAVARDNIFGVQFHPEKSHRFGMRLLTNFAEL